VPRFEASRHANFVDFTAMSVFMNTPEATALAHKTHSTTFPSMGYVPCHDTSGGGALFPNTKGFAQEKTTVESFQIVIHNTLWRNVFWPF
jgi:hypothetical protein